MKDRISVIVPAYNIEKELERCLDSIAAQTYGNIEIVVVNDGSKDGTGAIIDRYAAKDSRVIAIHKENGGVTSARLAGVRAATGQWIGFVDGDDYIEPDMYEKLMANALKYNADISHCGYQIRFADGRIRHFYNTGRLAEQDGTTGIKDLLSGSFVEPGLWNKLFRKSLFSSLLCEAAMPEDIKVNEDLLMNFYLFKEARRSVYEDFCPYHYLIRDTSATRQRLTRNALQDPVKVKEIMLQQAPEELREMLQGAYVQACINSCNRIVRNKDYGFEDIYEGLRKKIKEKKAWLKKLGRMHRMLAWLIVHGPKCHGLIYRFYFHKIAKHPYD